VPPGAASKPLGTTVGQAQNEPRTTLRTTRNAVGSWETHSEPPRTTTWTHSEHTCDPEYTQNHPKPPLGLTRNTLVTQNTLRTTRNGPRTTTWAHSEHTWDPEYTQNHPEPLLGLTRNMLVTQNTLRTTRNAVGSWETHSEPPRTTTWTHSEHTCDPEYT
jgi:hypothetical protein